MSLLQRFSGNSFTNVRDSPSGIARTERCNWRVLHTCELLAIVLAGLLLTIRLHLPRFLSGLLTLCLHLEYLPLAFPATVVAMRWPSFPRRPCGLVNVASSCYMNATMQSLFAVPTLQRLLSSFAQRKDLKESDCQLELSYAASTKTGGLVARAVTSRWFWIVFTMVCKWMPMNSL
jgi:hypothetical protein